MRRLVPGLCVLQKRPGGGGVAVEQKCTQKPPGWPLSSSESHVSPGGQSSLQEHGPPGCDEAPMQPGGFKPPVSAAVPASSVTLVVLRPEELQAATRTSKTRNEMGIRMSGRLIER